ncbi:MAG: sugar phosphate isomerase/epimerase [Myxococcales bacterium]|nr:sugar phosphate isomerase/epimerase [Myxococcales bacterium]
MGEAGPRTLANALSLHTWTLDTTPLALALAATRAAGWDAVELRRLDFTRAVKAGGTVEDVIAAVQASGLPVACVGIQMGWLFCGTDDYKRLLAALIDACGWARALGCSRLMSASDRGSGARDLAIGRIREFAAVAADAGLVLALEFNSSVQMVNSLRVARDLVSAAGHPGCRLLLDTYHLQRSGATVADVADIRGDEIAHVQFSDVPASGPAADHGTDRLPPGMGCIPFREMFAAILETGYSGPLCYEAPNPRAWARAPEEVAREALAATLALLPQQRR